MIDVVHFHRRPMGGQVSIERLFDVIRQAMPDNVRCLIHSCPQFSKGFWPRLLNMFDAANHQSQVNHITGDVHYLALFLKKQRTLLTVLDCASLERLNGWRRSVLLWIWYKLPIQHAKLVSVISESTRAELVRHIGCDPSKIRVVPCCVGSEFTPKSKSFDENDPVILHIGTADNKNLLRLIQGLDGLHCRLNIIGRLNPNQYAWLEKCHIRYANIPRATDAEIVEAYENCDILAFVSTYEGFGLPIIEANATGRPVVTSNILSMPEVAGNAACLVDPFDTNAIRKGIMKIWHDSMYRNSLVEAGFENVRRFSAKTVAAQYAAIYNEIAKTNT